MYFHVRSGPDATAGKGSDVFFLKYLKHFQLAGNMKNKMTTKIAGVASFILLKYQSPS